MSHDKKVSEMDLNAPESVNVTKLIRTGGAKVKFGVRMGTSEVQTRDDRAYTASALPEAYYLTLVDPVDVKLIFKKSGS